jgi:multiple sugar transport system ATP-binding protein
MSKVTLKNISKIYPENVKAVQDFNLEIKAREFVTIIGPSGCGKTTVLRMIAGLEEISEGEIYIGDTLVNDIPPKDRDLAMVFQNYALYPHMTVFENIAFGLRLRKVSKEKIQIKVDEVVQILDLSHLVKRKPKALSGGQRQRVALGRAMVRDPKVFLLDEPLSNLDAKLRAQMRAEIFRIHKSLGTTFVYVTHDQVEAMTMADRIVVMKDGCIQQVDTPKNLYDKPGNLFVAGFIGSPQMNFIDAVLVENSQEWFLKLNENLIKIPEGRFEQDKLKLFENREVVVGIRPEDIHEDAEFMAKEKTEVLSAEVEMTELLGAEAFLYLVLDKNHLVARVSASSSTKPGDRINIAIDSKKIHIFDKKTEKAL